MDENILFCTILLEISKISFIPVLISELLCPPRTPLSSSINLELSQGGSAVGLAKTAQLLL